jgi:hypothetical protein
MGCLGLRVFSNCLWVHAWSLVSGGGQYGYTAVQCTELYFVLLSGIGCRGCGEGGQYCLGKLHQYNCTVLYMKTVRFEEN